MKILRQKQRTRKKGANGFSDYGAEFDYPEALLAFGGPLTLEYLQRHLETEQRILENIEAKAKDSKERGGLTRQRIERLSDLIGRWEEVYG